MYIETVPNRNSPPAVLLREGYREGGKIVKRTLANLSHWDAQLVEHFRLLLKGGVAVESLDAVMTIERSLPHGHVAAVLGAARACGAEKWFASAPEESRSVLLAMLCARVLGPASKLATHRMLHDDTATSSLGRVLGVGQCQADDLYRALDWLHEAQPTLERALARKHLVGSTLVLYDLTSTWLTGHCCELAARGHSRDGKRDDPQIVFGLVCTSEGCPIAVEVFKGNTADPATVASQVAKLKERFGIQRLAWVGDRGMLTSARIEQVLKPQDMDWVSSLRAPQIALLAAEHGPFQPSLFDERNLVELTSEHFPGERLIVCRNPALAEERARKRGELLAATEADLGKIAAATQRARNPLRGEQAIALRVGRVIERFHMAKHLELTITDTALRWTRKTDAIAAEAALDGLYVIRTSLAATQLDGPAAVAAYKSLAHVERAFRCMKTIDLHVRLVFHYNTERVRAHVLLWRMLAYYVEWHMRECLKPHAVRRRVHRARPGRSCPARRQGAAQRAPPRRRTPPGAPTTARPCTAFEPLLQDLATLTYNITSTSPQPQRQDRHHHAPRAQSRPRRFRLLGVSPVCSQ